MRCSRLLCALTAMLLASPSQADAKPKPKGKPPAARKSGNGGAAGKQPAKEAGLPPPQGKVVVFAFEGEQRTTAAVQRQVISALKAKGLKVTTGLRPVDSAEQYREMSVTLGFVAFVDGEVAVDVDQGSATVFVRSGVTGLRVASATFAGERRSLAAEVGRGLWERVAEPLAEVCAEAAKPRKAERAPLRIEAGTPIETTPADAGGRM